MRTLFNNNELLRSLRERDLGLTTLHEHKLRYV